MFWICLVNGIILSSGEKGKSTTQGRHQKHLSANPKGQQPLFKDQFLIQIWAHCALKYIFVKLSKVPSQQSIDVKLNGYDSPLSVVLKY